MKKKLRLVALGSLFLFAGCDSLPSGNPPAENIVVNRRECRSEREISEHLATKFSLFMLENYPGSEFSLEADGPAEKIAAAAVAECGAVSGCRRKENAANVLRGRRVPGGWEFSFLENGRTKWREFYSVTEKMER